LWLYIIFAFVLGIENQFLFSIEEIQQKGNEKKLIIGKNNDIIFPELEDSTCIITETNNGFNVHLEKPVYLKIKDITQNLYPLYANSNIKYNGKQLETNKIISVIEKADKNKTTYFLLSDTLINNNIFVEDSLQSVLVNQKGKLSIIILDKGLTMADTIRFKSDFSVSDNQLKLIFVKAFETSFYEDNELKKYIRVKHYRTKFSAEHFLIRKVDDVWKIRFSDDLKACFSINELETLNSNNDFSLKTIFETMQR
jgi:hypothetical protein